MAVKKQHRHQQRESNGGGVAASKSGNISKATKHAKIGKIAINISNLST